MYALTALLVVKIWMSENKHNWGRDYGIFIPWGLFIHWKILFVNFNHLPPTLDPDGEIEYSGKSIFEIRFPNFCYIQVIVFDLSYQPVAAMGT